MLTANIKNNVTTLSNKSFRRPLIAHHGIQRSGTNVLNILLTEFVACPLNSFDPARNNPKHKHFRWQIDKDTIMPWAGNPYYNKAVVSDIKDLNDEACYPLECKHIVIKKNLLEWLPSILSWGMKVGWFKDKQHALDNTKKAALDWYYYYEFWEEMESKHPGSITVISFEAESDFIETFTRRLGSLGVPMRRTPSMDVIKNVPQSPLNRQNLITKNDINLPW